jgi:hypothetical protein
MACSAPGSRDCRPSNPIEGCEIDRRAGPHIVDIGTGGDAMPPRIFDIL